MTGVGQEDDDIDVSSDRVNGRSGQTRSLSSKVTPSLPLVVVMSLVFCVVTPTMPTRRSLQTQRREGRNRRSVRRAGPRAFALSRGKSAIIAVGENLAPAIVKLVVAERDGVVADGCHHASKIGRP